MNQKWTDKYPRALITFLPTCSVWPLTLNLTHALKSVTASGTTLFWWSPCLHKKGMHEIPNDLLVPKCMTKSEGVYLRMNRAVYMDARTLEFNGGGKESMKCAAKRYGSYVPHKMCNTDLWECIP